MLFEDRKDAANKLYPLLENYKNDKNALIVGLPRGGVILAEILSKKLNIEFDIIVPKKICSPFDLELAIGAVCENSKYLNEQLIKDFNIPEIYIKEEVENARKLASKKTKLYRKNRPPIQVSGKTIILVDDGIATGATIIAAILALKEKKAKKFIVCSPVVPYPTISILKNLVDEVICLYIPDNFFAIAQFYKSFEEVSDDILINILK